MADKVVRKTTNIENGMRLVLKRRLVWGAFLSSTRKNYAAGWVPENAKLRERN